MLYALPVLVAAIAVISLLLTPKAKEASGFFKGAAPNGLPPSLITLTLSQVTTWIFARSLLNAAILGFYYGIWGTLAYATYYLSFLTGGKIIDAIRFRHGYDSIQDFLRDRFGSLGTRCYNLVIALRLISEVFANILVIAILFGAVGSQSYILAVVAFAVISLSYSMLGGLHASLKTDVFQMIVFLIVLAALLVIAFGSESIQISQLFAVEFDITNPGPILLIVAFLQIWSYPMHDPVMMDRGLLADRETTRKSFLHAGWISITCILLFGSLGVLAGFHAQDGETMNVVLMRLLGDIPMVLFNATLVISAMSTLDSTLSSSAKLVASDMRIVNPTIRNGRIVMLVFMLLGVGMVFLGNKDLFSAVAVSGTAALYLVPVIVFSVWLNVNTIPNWSYAVSFVSAILGSILYFTESSSHTSLLGDSHKYTKLLWISMTVIVIGIGAFLIGNVLKISNNKKVVLHHDDN